MPEHTDLDLRRDYFATLRHEILEVKARLARLVVIGLIGAPILTYFTVTSEGMTHLFMTIIAPLLVLLLLVLYFAEQASMMRAGRFIRDNVEGGEGDWERWVEANRGRASEPPVFGLFALAAMGYFILMASLALVTIIEIDPKDFPLFITLVCKIAVPVIYGVSLLWVVIILLRFWHNAFRTT